MGNPIWIEVCSCGVLTGNLTIARREPLAGIPRPGHEEHEVSYEQLCEDGARMTTEQRKRLHDSAQAFRWAAVPPAGGP